MEDISGEGEEWWDGGVEGWEAEVEPENGAGVWACSSSALETLSVQAHKASMPGIVQVSAHRL